MHGLEGFHLTAFHMQCSSSIFHSESANAHSSKLTSSCACRMFCCRDTMPWVFHGMTPGEANDKGGKQHLPPAARKETTLTNSRSDLQHALRHLA